MGFLHEVPTSRRKRTYTQVFYQNTLTGLSGYKATTRRGNAPTPAQLHAPDRCNALYQPPLPPSRPGALTTHSFLLLLPRVPATLKRGWLRGQRLPRAQTAGRAHLTLLPPLGGTEEGAAQEPSRGGKDLPAHRAFKRAPAGRRRSERSTTPDVPPLPARH